MSKESKSESSNKGASFSDTAVAVATGGLSAIGDSIAKGGSKDKDK